VNSRADARQETIVAVVSVNLRKVENIVIQFGKVEEVSYPALMVLLIQVANREAGL
jgi:hypothetical protein